MKRFLNDHRNDKKTHAGRALFFFAALIIGVSASCLLVGQAPQFAAMFWSWSHAYGIADQAYGIVPNFLNILSGGSGNNNPTSTIVAISPGNITAYTFGIASGDTLPWVSSSTLNAEMNDMAALNVGWIRMDFAWYEIQPNNSSSYSNLASFDRVVAAAKARNIKILGTIAYTPAWARSAACPTTPNCEPADPAAFATFAQFIAARYAPQGVTDWEIWNEPNLGFWKPAPNVADYLVNLEDAYIAIKAVQPNAFIISAGLAPAPNAGTAIAPATFLSGLYALGGKPYFDAVGMHPYSFPAMPSYYATWNAWSQMASTTPSLRSVMIANGDSAKQIWLTEYGAPTGGPGNIETSVTDTQFLGNPDHVTEAVQASMLASAYTATQKFPWAGPLFWYSYDDIGTSQVTNENFFGIINNDGTTKQAYTALKNLL